MSRSSMSISENGLIASMTALAIILHIIRFPFPLATFLKYDLSGVPLILLVLLVPFRKAVVSIPFFGIGVFLLSGDPVGAFMKSLAELSSMAGAVFVYNRFGKIVLVLVSATTRTIIMLLANIAITPLWLMYFARACDTYGICLSITLMYIPAIALFNISLGLIVASIAVVLEGYVKRIVAGWSGEK